MIQIYQRKTNLCLLNTCNVWWTCQRVPYLFAPRTCWLFQIFLRIMICLVVFSVCNSEISVLGDFPSHYIIVYHFLVSSLLSFRFLCFLFLTYILNVQPWDITPWGPLYHNILSLHKIPSKSKNQQFLHFGVGGEGIPDIHSDLTKKSDTGQHLQFRESINVSVYNQ